MKKIIVSINHYFSNFLLYVLIMGFLVLYVMHKVPIHYWIGRIAGQSFIDNIGSIFIEFFDFSYMAFIFQPLLPFLIGFLILSIFIWIFYRKDEEAGKEGFRGMIIAILAIFLLFYLPTKAADLSYKIREGRDAEIKNFHTADFKKVSVISPREFYSLYQSLADEGLQEWRKNPIEVVKHELERGNLTSLNKENNELSLKSMEEKEKGKSSEAVVELKNDFFQAEIYLSSFWESDDGIWIVKRYKRIR